MHALPSMIQFFVLTLLELDTLSRIELQRSDPTMSAAVVLSPPACAAVELGGFLGDRSGPDMALMK